MKHLFLPHRNRDHQRSLLGVSLLSLLLLSAVFFVACDQQNPVAVDQQSRSEQSDRVKELLPNVIIQTMDMETARFSFQGKLFNREEFHQMFKDKTFSTVVAGTGLPDENVIYAFDSETAFNDWAKTTQFADKFAQMNETASEAEPRAGAVYYDELPSKAVLAKVSQTQKAVALLFEHINYYGQGFVCYSPSRFPQLPKYINNESSSVIVSNYSSTKTVFAFYNFKNYNKDNPNAKQMIITVYGAWQGWSCPDLEHANFPPFPFIFDFNDLFSSMKVY